MALRTLTTRDHRRDLDENRYVYAVLSRRSAGVSIGVNLNPDKVCNFDCVYCQVDRSLPGRYRRVDLTILEQELKDLLARAKSGDLFERPPFYGIPEPYRQVVDIALSGDGEPTTSPYFKEAVELAIRLRAESGLGHLKIVIITNATMFHRPKVSEALGLLGQHRGEIWAKLDAGTEEYYRLVDLTTIPFQQVLNNIVDVARSHPVVIQSLFMRIRGIGPDKNEITAYCSRLREIVTRGGKINLVQVCTVARHPAQPYVSPLPNGEVDGITEAVRRIPLPVLPFYSGQEG
jgi:wyosine [tRNA(Phe)-imidazoG37] synthetase (radical SAM superfamily)